MAYTNNLTERTKLHKQLITRDNTPCLCGSLNKRQIHRLIPTLGYSISNIQVLCYMCHCKAHPHSKFIIGNKVVLNGRTPRWIDLAHHRPRTIIDIRYDTKKQCNFYLLGCNGRGACSGQGNPLNGFNEYWFRSYQLQAPRRYHHIKHRGGKQWK